MSEISTPRGKDSIASHLKGTQTSDKEDQLIESLRQAYLRVDLCQKVLAGLNTLPHRKNIGILEAVNGLVYWLNKYGEYKLYIPHAAQLPETDLPLRQISVQESQDMLPMLDM